MHTSKVVSTSMSTSEKLTMFDGYDFNDPQWYHNVVANLQYLAFTQPDISFNVNHLCQYMQYPRILHKQVVKQILYYLDHTIHPCLYFTSNSSYALSAYADAN